MIIEIAMMVFMMGSVLKVGLGIWGKSEILQPIIRILSRIVIRKVFERNGFGQRREERAAS